MEGHLTFSPMGCGHNRQLLPGLSSKRKLSHCQNFKEANVFQIQAQSNFTASWSIKLGPSGSPHCNKSGALSILWAFPDSVISVPLSLIFLSWEHNFWASINLRKSLIFYRLYWFSSSFLTSVRILAKKSDMTEHAHTLISVNLQLQTAFQFIIKTSRHYAITVVIPPLKLCHEGPSIPYSPALIHHFWPRLKKKNKKKQNKIKQETNTFSI